MPMRLKTSIEIFNYWDRLRGADPAPLRSQIDPSSIRRTLPELFILEAADKPFFRLAGTHVCGFFGRELRDAAFGSLWGDTQGEDAEKIAAGVMAHAMPTLINATGYGSRGNSMAFEIVLMPLRSSVDACDRLLGSIAPAGNSVWLGADPLDFLALDRSRLLNDRGAIPAQSVEEQDSGRSLFATRGAELGHMVRRVMHLRIFEGGRAG
ncbi:hypothetical protein EV286_103184 [Rhizobium sp. BK251]|nr:hypothetical protein EV286_103184 [Rhizobium sp. BK251]